MATNPRYRAARTASFVNAATNSLLAIFKIIIGYIGHSHALIADGLHSFSDLLTDALVLIAAKAGGRHPDQSHPYGHQRIETFASIIISIVVVGVAVTIAYDALPYLLSGKVSLKPELSVVIVAVISILANEWLYRYTLGVGKKINSQLLITNAWHNRTDAFVSTIVLISVIGTWAGYRHLDTIGALIIALLIFKMGLKMIWNSVKELIDTGADEKTLAQIKEHVHQMSGVDSIHQLRTRLHGGNVLVDLHLIVNPKISVSEGHYIAEKVALHLIQNINQVSDVTVHIDPEDDERYKPSMSLLDREQLKEKLESCWKELPGYDAINKMLLHYLNGKLSVEVFMPLSATQGKQLQELTKDYQEAAKSIHEIEDVILYFSP